MAITDRSCSKCGNKFPRDLMTVKRVSFHEFGRNGRLKKSRTVAWLCPQDLQMDKEWSADSYLQQKHQTDEEFAP